MVIQPAGNFPATALVVACAISQEVPLRIANGASDAEMEKVLMARADLILRVAAKFQEFPTPKI